MTGPIQRIFWSFQLPYSLNIFYRIHQTKYGFLVWISLILPFTPLLFPFLIWSSLELLQYSVVLLILVGKNWASQHLLSSNTQVLPWVILHEATDVGSNKTSPWWLGCFVQLLERVHPVLHRLSWSSNGTWFLPSQVWIRYHNGCVQLWIHLHCRYEKHRLMHSCEIWPSWLLAS